MPHDTTKKVLIINGSIRGKEGNSGKIVSQALGYLNEQANMTAGVLTLTNNMPAIEDVCSTLTQYHGFFIVTGNYWNSFGSPLQRFVEVMTAYEHTPSFFGKPLACAVSMDSVGGMEVASRVHSVFSGLGCWSPPCATIVLSRVASEAIAASKGKDNDPNDDVWSMADLKIVLQNLVATTQVKVDWQSWPHVKLKSEGPWPHSGILDMDSPKFL
ncbi:MAG: NADPH-dependent oxidoreductase [Sphingobacteriales bacterium]|nr:MAG: NADPH-dependent oxidoreductase [Sphingobacteriales bacterium]